MWESIWLILYLQMTPLAILWHLEERGAVEHGGTYHRINRQALGVATAIGVVRRKQMSESKSGHRNSRAHADWEGLKGN